MIMLCFNLTCAGTLNYLIFWTKVHCGRTIILFIIFFQTGKENLLRNRSNFVNFNLFYQNISGMKSKLTDLYLKLWLKKSVLSSEIFCSTYSIYRCHQNTKNSTHLNSEGQGSHCSSLIIFFSRSGIVKLRRHWNYMLKARERIVTSHLFPAALLWYIGWCWLQMYLSSNSSIRADTSWDDNR